MGQPICVFTLHFLLCNLAISSKHHIVSRIAWEKKEKKRELVWSPILIENKTIFIDRFRGVQLGKAL